MEIHITAAALQLTALAAFLILWYFWVKKKLRSARYSDDIDQGLLSFRRVFRLLLGLVFLTSISQIYLLWASSTIREKNAPISYMDKQQAQNIKAINELKGIIESLRKETASNSRLLLVRKLEQGCDLKDQESLDGRRSPTDGSSDELAGTNRQAGSVRSEGGGFGKEAKASSVTNVQKAAEQRLKIDADRHEQIYSMRLSRQGRVAAEKLRVRKRPQQDAEVIEKLFSGQRVKVTEKRLLNDNMWFRVITPSGRAGWVDFRYLTLDVSP